MAAKRSVLWFRKGLRVHDNPALVKACLDVAWRAGLAEPRPDA